MSIDRPETFFDGASHTYTVEGEDVLGVSTIAKIGGAEETWGVASAWGFRIGYEGAFDVFFDKDDPFGIVHKDQLREELKKRGLTPWNKRDKAAERGNWVHDVLEQLGQHGTVPDINAFEPEVRGHVRSLMRWFVHFRPEFVAVEVQVASREHRFAGRYDIRAKIDAKRLVDCIDPIRTDDQAEHIRYLAYSNLPALGLLDLKTSKGVYPTQHFPQLEGYEGASVEMGFPPTDFRAVINTSEDGSFDPAYRKLDHREAWTLGDFAVSWACYDDFVAYLGALRAIRRIGALDPEEERKRAFERVLIDSLPARSRDLAESVPELAGYTSRSIGMMLGQLRKRGLVTQDKGVWSQA